MSVKDLEPFIRLVPEENVIFKKQGLFADKEGLILLTNKRIVGIEFRYKG